jgi:isocitrate dehydrogenase (NAD+)
MTAKLIDPQTPHAVSCSGHAQTCTAIFSPMRRPSFRAASAPSGSANIGKRYAMFEAIHGSAPRMMEEGAASTPDPAA